MRRFFRSLFRLIVLLLLIALGLLAAFRTKFNSSIRTLARTQVMNATSDLINDSIDRQIEIENVRYDRIVYFEKDLDGKITALKTNMSEVNRLKTDILNLINDEILELDSSDVGVAIGSLILPEFFAGRGLEIPVQILSIRNSDASFNSNFTQAGINQTLHQIVMEVSVDVTVLVLGRTDSFTISSQVVIAETIIVGQVPDTFLQSGLQSGGQYGSG